jgi:hypothetical protein
MDYSLFGPKMGNIWQYLENEKTIVLILDSEWHSLTTMCQGKPIPSDPNKQFAFFQLQHFKVEQTIYPYKV